MIAAADHDNAARGLGLGMALQAKSGVALREHLLINRAMWLVAGVATLAQSFVLEHKRPALHRVALETGFVRPGQIRSPALERGALMRIVAVAAADLSFEHRMTMGQLKLPFHILMALETGFRGAARIDDPDAAAARLYVFAAGAVT